MTGLLFAIGGDTHVPKISSAAAGAGAISIARENPATIALGEIAVFMVFSFKWVVKKSVGCRLLRIVFCHSYTEQTTFAMKKPVHAGTG